MTKSEYLIGHKASGFKKGDRVKVLRKALDYEDGWNLFWNPLMDDLVNRDDGYIIYDYEDRGFNVAFKGRGKGTVFPYFVLERVIVTAQIRRKDALEQYRRELKYPRYTESDVINICETLIERVKNNHSGDIEYFDLIFGNNEERISLAKELINEMKSKYR